MSFLLSYNALCIRECCVVHMHMGHIKAFTLSVCVQISRTYLQHLKLEKSISCRLTHGFLFKAMLTLVHQSNVMEVYLPD